MIVMEISVISLEKLLVLHCSCKWKSLPNALYVPCLCVSPLLLPRTGLQNNSSSLQLLQRPVQLRSSPQTRQTISQFFQLVLFRSLGLFSLFSSWWFAVKHHGYEMEMSEVAALFSWFCRGTIPWGTNGFCKGYRNQGAIVYELWNTILISENQCRWVRIASFLFICQMHLECRCGSECNSQFYLCAPVLQNKDFRWIKPYQIWGLYVAFWIGMTAYLSEICLI